MAAALSPPDQRAGSGMVLSDKYRPASDTWGVAPLMSYCYDVEGHPHRKLVVRPDGSFALHTRPSPTTPSQVVSSGTAGAIYRVDPMTGRPPGAAVRREAEIQSETARQWSQVVEAFFPGSPIGRISRPPDTFIEIVRDDITSTSEETLSPAPEPRKPTRFELIEF